MSISPKVRSKLLILILAIISCSISNQIVDFQYTEYSQNFHDNNVEKANFNFKPQQISASKLQFPQACHLIDELNQPIQQNQTQLKDSDIDTYLHSMKQKFLNLLALTQKLSNSEEKILHFQRLINQTNPVQPQQKRLDQLQNLQNKLLNYTLNITQKNNQLKSNLQQIQSTSNNYHLSQSKRIELDYQIDALKQKIYYLENLQQKVKLSQARAPNDVDYNNYFDQLEREFNNESELIQNIDLIIQKKDRLNKLRRQKANLDSSILALELYIKQIQQCNKQKQNIRKQFKNHQKINQLIHQLQELKKNQQPDNPYCEGVVKKLTEKIITMLRYYDIVASCASDLDPKIQLLVRQKQQMKDIEQEIARLQALTNLQDFEKVYKSQKATIEAMYSKIRDWKMKQFFHDTQKINQLRDQAKDALQRLQQQRRSLTPPVETTSQNSLQKTIPVKIIDLINEIKDLKLKYCGVYHQYDKLANHLWADIYRFESEMNLKNKLRNLYNQQRRNYANMYQELLLLRSTIYADLN